MIGHPFACTVITVVKSFTAGALVLLCGACALFGGGASSPTAPVSARFELLDRDPFGGAGSYRQVGLRGTNKPNGMEYRLRRSIPRVTPSFVPRTLDGLELFIADPAPEGWMAFYREPLDMWVWSENPRFRVILFDERGKRFWDLELNRFLSRPADLEIQDIRYYGRRLYFNEACQSYSREAGGECSALVKVDPWYRRVEWRTPNLISNNVFIVHDPWIIAGYGFTNEPDALFLVEQRSGKVVGRRGIDTAHQYFEVRDGKLVVVTHASVYIFRLPARQ